jgi:hypothetical protein
MATILKRFEIWLLLALVIAGIWWAFQAETMEVAATVPNQATPGQVPGNEVESNDSSLLEVKNVQLSPTEQGTVIELTLFGRSGTEDPVTLGAENVELLTSEGEDVHRFYLPFDPDPMLSAEEKSLVKLNFWLTSPVEVLWLTYRDQTVKVEIPPVSI